MNHLSNEAEVRRRLWKVFQVGRPEAPPQINSESLAFQGYYYLRSGWEPDDYFLYFQSIGQPILSGREENTGFSLYGHNGSLLLCPAPAVDGRTQDVHHGLVMTPGGKTPFATYGRPDLVKDGRFLAGDQKKFSKRDRQQTEVSRAAQFSQQVAIHWQGQGPQVLVTLVTPQGRGYTTAPPLSVMRGVTPIAPRPDLAGFTGKFADGTAIAYQAAARPCTLTAGDIEATASALLLTGDHGLTLDCTQIAGVAPPYSDFTFRLAGGQVVAEQPIYRPIRPVVIEPLANVFTDTTTVTLTCATPDVDVHYTLDGSRPVPQSPRYAGPFRVVNTCRLQARAFRRGVTEDVWQQDGTHATVVSSTVLHKEPLTPANRRK